MTNIKREKQKEEAKYKVYMHINKLNEKVYIGVTKRKRVKDRWQNGNGYRSQIQFYNAIRKYGWNGFYHKVLYYGLTKEEAAEKEKELIAKYDSTNPLYGYNIDKGGFEIRPERLNKMYRAKYKHNEKISLHSKFNDELLVIFENAKDAAEKTGLTEEYILNCCDRKIINKYYDFEYCRKIV